ncbi:MAG: DUF5777 family beta-barrel protein [Cytophagales bacterium]|nr:DUF5777 family beta-barrel protein [Cytophagales bacterium]
MKNSTKYMLLIFSISINYCLAQEDLMNLIEDDDKKTSITTSTFKGTRIISGHSVETRGAGTLDIIFMHRFGKINSGAYNLWGLDEAWIRLGAEYAIGNAFTVGAGRSSYEKTYDGFVKYKFLKQTKGLKNFPVTGTAFISMAINTLKPTDETQDVKLSSRISYTYQILLARKFNEMLSLQLTPTLVHHNLVRTPEEHNDIIALGLSGRHKISRRMAITFEYFYQFNNNTDEVNYDPFGIGLEIETGGHVFQLVFANSQAMIEQQFITGTTGDFFEGDIHFGFNITRTFHLKKNSAPANWQ